MTADTQECIPVDGYWTGGTLLCPLTGDTQLLTQTEATGDLVCTSDDIQWNSPLSHDSLK